MPPAASDAAAIEAELDRLKAGIDQLWARYDEAIGAADRATLVELSAALTELELERSDLRLALESLQVNSPRWDAMLAMLRVVNDDLQEGLRELKAVAHALDLATKAVNAIKGVVAALL